MDSMEALVQEALLSLRYCYRIESVELTKFPDLHCWLKNNLAEVENSISSSRFHRKDALFVKVLHIISEVWSG